MKLLFLKWRVLICISTFIFQSCKIFESNQKDSSISEHEIVRENGTTCPENKLRSYIVKKDATIDKNSFEIEGIELLEDPKENMKVWFTICDDDVNEVGKEQLVAVFFDSRYLGASVYLTIDKNRKDAELIDTIEIGSGEAESLKTPLSQISFKFNKKTKEVDFKFEGNEKLELSFIMRTYLPKNNGKPGTVYGGIYEGQFNYPYNYVGSIAEFSPNEINRRLCPNTATTGSSTEIINTDIVKATVVYCTSVINMGGKRIWPGSLKIEERNEDEKWGVVVDLHSAEQIREYYFFATTHHNWCDYSGFKYKGYEEISDCETNRIRKNGSSPWDVKIKVGEPQRESEGASLKDIEENTRQRLIVEGVISSDDIWYIDFKTLQKTLN